MKFHAGHRSLLLALVALYVCAACAPRVGTHATSSGAQQMIVRAQKAGWTAAEVTRLRTVLTDAESLSEEERQRVKCRLGRVFQARKPLTLLVLREAGATPAELTSANVGLVSDPGKPGAPAPRMTVRDAMRACRCENNPLDRVIGKQALGAFGGPSCELGTRLRCLREADNDIPGPRDPDCMRMLQDDNKRSLAAQMKQCAVISCGTDAIIGKDCSCSSYGGSAGGGGGFDRCATVRCESGKRPVSDGIRCTCTDDVGGVAGAPGMPTVGCPPGSPPGCKPPAPGPVRVPGRTPPSVPGRGIPPPVPKCAPDTPGC